MNPSFVRPTLAWLAACTLVACGGDDAPTARLLLTAEAPGARCASGGSRIDAGVDGDGSGALEATEVASTQYVCHGGPGAAGTAGAAGPTGVAGAAGASVLVATTPEPAGARCPTGGQRIAAGLDADRNGVLDAAEVASVGHVCHGAAGPGVTWSVATATEVQAVAGGGILADHAQQVAVTLPAAPSIGDLVHVTGVGTGGFRIAQNAGQRIETGNVTGGTIGETWAARETPRAWRAVASSAGGDRLVAAVQGGQLHVSADGGLSWAPRETSREWIAVASSADGLRLVAAVDGGRLHVSADGGATWSARDSDRAWRAVASSADGIRLVAVAAGGRVHVSGDAGATWSARESDRAWAAVVSSADGMRLVAAGPGTAIHRSVDGGATWAPLATAQAWSALATSADGSRLAATVAGGGIHISVDGGGTWTPRELDRGWRAVAASADGTRLVAAVAGGRLHVSNDSGTTWAPRAPAGRLWQSVASSADGTRLVAVEEAGTVHVSAPSVAEATATGPAGTLVGRRHDAIDLQYVGNGRFVVRSAAGVFDVATSRAPAVATGAAPLVAMPSLPLTFVAGSAAATLDPAATVADADTGDLAGGTLTVRLDAATADATDRLQLRPTGTGAGQISIDGPRVAYEGTVVGLHGGEAAGATPLVVHLGPGATPAAVQALLRAVAYRSAEPVDPPNADRIAQAVVVDGSGGRGVAASQTVRVHDRPSGLLAHWTFDEPPSGTTALDWSGAGRDATLVNLTPADWTPAGAIGRALATSAAAGAFATTAVDLKAANDFSLSLWIRPNAAAAAQVQHLLWQGAAGQNGWGAGLAPSAAGHEMHLSLNYFNGCVAGLTFFLGSTDPREAGTCAERSNALVSHALPSPSAWTHVVVTVRGASAALATVELHVDGVLRSTDTSDELDRSAWLGGLQLAKPDTNTRHYTGETDHVRVFGRALGAAEIAVLHQEGRR